MDYDLRIFPGETIPVDGKIIKGNTSIDQAIITDESLPIDKKIGDNVFCGTINCFGTIDIKATEVGEDSSLQKMIRMVQDVENKKAPMERITDKWATWLVPMSLIFSIVTFIITKDIVRAVTILVVFCPCALVMATPTAIMAAIGQATKYGVIIKSGESLENMGKVNTIAFDKTGTLTFGKLEVSDIISFSSKFNEQMLISLVASAETLSEHPLGKAIVTYAKDKKLPLMETKNFGMEPGKGIHANISGHNLFCGSENYLKENVVNIPNEVNEILENLRIQGKALILVAIDGIFTSIIALSDILRPTAREMVTKLADMNTQTILLTGENIRTADYFAKKVGISFIQAELLPEDKVNNIIKLQQKGKIICMMGDGVNDAPALKIANVGVAMGNMGSDIAVEAADIALMNDDISKITYIKRLSNSTVNTIKFSITLALFINFIAIIMSLMGMLTPTTGALVHNAGSMLVVLIAAMLYDRNFING